MKLLEYYTKMTVVKKATIWFLICSILQKGIAFLTTPIFTRLLTTEQYGQYSIYITWFQILTLITSFRLDYAVFNKGMSKYEKDKESYTSTMQILTMFFSLFFFIIYMIFNKQINCFTGLNTFLSILMFVNVLFMNAVSFWSIRKRYDYKYKSVVIVTLLLTILTTLVGIVAVHIFNEKGMARIVSLAIIQIIIGIVIFIVILKQSKKYFNIAYAKFAVFFNLPLIPHFLSLYILEQSDKIMIQKASNLMNVGIYSVAYSIGNAINIISNSVNQAIVPWLYQKLNEKDYKEISKNMIYIFIFVLMIISIFIMVVPELLIFMASNEYRDAIYVIAPVAASTFFSFVYGLFATIEFYFDKNKFSMFISGIAAITNIVLNFIFINIFDYRAAGYTTMICYAILAIGHLCYTNNILKFKENRYLIKNSLMICIITSMILLVIISQILNNCLIFRYLLLIFTLLIVFLKRKIIIKKINELKSAKKKGI